MRELTDTPTLPAPTGELLDTFGEAVSSWAAAAALIVQDGGDGRTADTTRVRETRSALVARLQQLERDAQLLDELERQYEVLHLVSHTGEPSRTWSKRPVDSLTVPRPLREWLRSALRISR